MRIGSFAKAGILVHRMRIVAVPGTHGVETELMVTFRIAANEFDGVNDRRGLMNALGQEGANENHGAIGEHALKGNVLAGEIVPGEVGLLDEEGLVFVPAGDFDAAALGWRQSFGYGHNGSGKGECI
jgi:hypothetical protein